MRNTIVFAGALALVGCSGGGGDLRNHFKDMATPPDMAMKPMYPSGPYGNHPSDVLADWTVSGYRLTTANTDSTKVPWETDIKLSDYYMDPTCKCLLLTVGARWCGACQQEQPSVIADVQQDPHFCVMGILIDGLQPGVAATKDDVDAWTQMYKQDFTVVQGTFASTQGLFKGWDMQGTIGLPFSLIVKPGDMTVATDAVQGFDPNIYSNAMAACGQ